MLSAPIKSRLVLYFPGFEAITSKAQLDRLKYNTDKSAPIWNFDCQRHSLDVDHDCATAVTENETHGKDWKVDTKIVLFDWSDIAGSYLGTSYPLNLIKFFPKFITFFLDGTNIHYFKASKRYWSFSIFPLLVILLFIVASWLLAAGISALLFPALSGWTKGVMVFFVTLGFTIILCKWPGDRIYLNLTINMSGFIRALAKGNNSEIGQRSDVFAAQMAKEINGHNYDEILIVGHSIGVVWAVLALSKALKINADMLKSTGAVFLALGSNFPRTGLAPCAQYLRDHLRHVMDNEDLFWHDIQTKDDLVSFYKADPFKILGVEKTRAPYVVDRVRFKTAMARERYRQMRKSFYRTHRQYVMRYDKPVHFDFILRCFGPLSAKELALDHSLSDRIAAQPDNSDTRNK